MNALRMGAGMEYDRTKLVPEVTRLLNSADDALKTEEAHGKTKFCNKWGDFLVERSLIKKQP
jgi:hypothetical protein